MNKVKTLSINKQEIQLNKVWMYIKDIIPYLGLISLLILFGTTTDGRFLRVSNIGVILKQSAIVLVGTMGTTFVMAHGNLDFSLGGELALCSLAGWYASQLHPALILPVCVLTGVVLSYIIAKVHVKLNVPVFTAGLCVLFIGKSVVMTLGSTTVMTTPAVYNKFDTVNFYLIVSAVVIVIAYILFEYTKIGKFNKSIGVNPNAAIYSGIPVDKYKV